MFDCMAKSGPISDRFLLFGHKLSELGPNSDKDCPNWDFPPYFPAKVSADWSLTKQKLYVMIRAYQTNTRSQNEQ